MAEHRGILILGEISEGSLTITTAELLNTGRRLADELKEPLNILLIGRNLQETAQSAISLGADVVYLIEGPPFAESLPELYVLLIDNFYQKIQPTIAFFGQTDMGRDVAPRLGARQDANVCLDCIQLDIDSDTNSLLQTKPVYGGNALAVWASPLTHPQIITMRPRTSEPADTDVTREGKIIQIKVDVDEKMIKSNLLETVKKEAKGIRLEDAKVIVAGGGGIGSDQGFQVIQELAHLLHGAVGVSRVPCDEGWMSSNLEIGQTGHVVSPDIYIAVGISGAPQHMAGCSSSKIIVAINKDPDAHVFKEADYGIVGDYREALLALIEKLKELGVNP